MRVTYKGERVSLPFRIVLECGNIIEVFAGPNPQMPWGAHMYRQGDYHTCHLNLRWSRRGGVYDIEEVCDECYAEHEAGR